MLGVTRKECSSRKRRSLGGLWLALVLACNAGSAAIADLDDAAARAQYAFYTRDERALRAALGDLERLSVPSDRASSLAYQLGVGYWHLADITTATGRTQALERCSQHLESAAKLDPRHAEALAVRGLCVHQQNGLLSTGARALKRECERQSSLAKAIELAPRNPRVLYAQALCAMNDGNAAKALEHAQRASATFERLLFSADDAATWGHAETYLLLANLQLRNGERAAAREAVEQALVLAPEYIAARELLTQISSGR